MIELSAFLTTCPEYVTSCTGTDARYEKNLSGPNRELREKEPSDTEGHRKKDRNRFVAVKKEDPKS